MVEEIKALKDFIGIENILRIEGLFQSLHGADFWLGVLEGEVGRFGQTDSVFASDGATATRCTRRFDVSFRWSALIASSRTSGDTAPLR